MEFLRNAYQHLHTSEVAGMRRFPVSFVIVCLLLVQSCHSDDKTSDAGAPQLPTHEEICACYGLYLQGDYAGYVAAMQSCDGKTPAYRKQMVHLLKQHAKLSADRNGKVLSVRVNRIEPHDGGRMLNVFLITQYEDGTNEEILLPMVYDGSRWRLQ